ncbi:hypothetical protein DC522_01420 [Microvirga sp. KLBC 81]|uniref:hypothetical protein n=1 Tax=Microvirga sp. KLBC 81 TaxID=1862707 RepID=UPI000D50F375|nr:hypothetical protein [Microvirga sp. KLBC 81]PVE26451.1 hypothetical protein DC522_01420 [Microvirga sp. KLBC 81]
MSTKQDVLSRRSTLGGALAVLAASPTPAAATPTGDDSALIALCQECRQEVERLQDAYRQVDEAEKAGLDWASGLGAYHKHAVEISDRVREMENRIARTRARTPDGMIAKVRAVVEDPAAIQDVGDFARVLEERLDAGHLIGLSLILDVMNMNERGA